MKIQVIETETGEVVKEIDCGNSERKADRVFDGMMINLNHDKYHLCQTEEA